MADISITKYKTKVSKPTASPSNPGYPTSDPIDPVNPPASGSNTGNSAIGITLNGFTIGGVKNLIELNDTLNIPQHYEYNLFNLNVDGLIQNDGVINLLGESELIINDESAIKTTASADQSLPSGILTILDYDSTIINNNTLLYSLSTDGRITINETGIYSITAGVVIEADALTALESAFLGIFRNGDLVAISSINTTISAGAQSGLSTATILSISNSDIIDCRALVTSVGGVAPGLARRLGTLLGANATQVNSLSIVKCSF